MVNLLPLVAVLVCVAQAAPAALAVTDTIDLLQVDIAEEEIAVPCPLCAQSMVTFLDFCRDVGGKSVPHVSDFVGACSLLGEEEMRKQDRANGCDSETRSRARVWNRKLKCLRIYQAMSTMYTPYDPCTSARTLVQSAPMAVCHSAEVKCVPPPSDDEFNFKPHWHNATFTEEIPPLKCTQYVADIETACKTVKGADFYERSNLDKFCSGNYPSKHQVAGCEIVRQKMVAPDAMLDLCSSLHAVPINVPYQQYCNATLDLAPSETIMTPSYAAYLERRQLYREMWETQSLKGSDPRYAPAVFPKDSESVQLNKTANATEVAVDVQL